MGCEWMRTAGGCNIDGSKDALPVFCLICPCMLGQMRQDRKSSAAPCVRQTEGVLYCPIKKTQGHKDKEKKGPVYAH